METLRMYFKLLAIALKSMVQFRGDFLIGILGVIVMNGANLLAIGVILGRFFDLAGWTIWEIVFLYGIWMTGNSIYSLLFFHITDLEDYLIEGRFDLFLIRPLSPFLMLLTVDVNFNGVADVVFGVAALGLAMAHLRLAFNTAQAAYLVVMLVCAALLELGITLALAGGPSGRRNRAGWSTR
jgi:ABC-2 type transport system permease protein